MPIYILFGLPGAGKTYVGKIFEKYFGYYLYDGDQDMPGEMRASMKTSTIFTDKMRDKFFDNLLKSIKSLVKKQDRIVIAQTFIKEKYRKLFLDNAPDIKFILIKTQDSIREARLKKRINYPLDIEYTRKMCRIFEEPKIVYEVIDNNVDGERNIKKQIKEIIKKNYD